MQSLKIFLKIESFLISIILLSPWAWIHLSDLFSKELLAESRALKHKTGKL